jgi:hypothetical protein
LLGGRAYRSAATATTFEQDAYLMALLRKHHIVEAVEADGDVLAAILGSGQIAEFLAALLVVDGTEWSRTGAELNARTFNGLTDVDDKARLFSAVESLLAGFFALGGASSVNSPTSSTATATESQRRESRKLRRPRVTGHENSSENGPMSSPPSLSSTASG